MPARGQDAARRHLAVYRATLDSMIDITFLPEVGVDREVLMTKLLEAVAAKL